LIETNALPLSQTANPNLKAKVNGWTFEAAVGAEAKASAQAPTQYV